MSDDLYDRLLAEARTGCWCATTRKPCSYHEGFADGMEAYARALGPIPSKVMAYWHRLPGLCNHLASEVGGECGHADKGTWMPLYAPPPTAGPDHHPPTKETQ